MLETRMINLHTLTTNFTDMIIQHLQDVRMVSKITKCDFGHKIL